jgi:hypothetical protein
VWCGFFDSYQWQMCARCEMSMIFDKMRPFKWNMCRQYDIGTSIVHNTSISLGGNTEGFTLGQTFPREVAVMVKKHLHLLVTTLVLCCCKAVWLFRPERHSIRSCRLQEWKAYPGRKGRYPSLRTAGSDIARPRTHRPNR